MKREYTIICDNREKKPLVFPATLTTLNELKLPTSRNPRTTVVLHTRSECLNVCHDQMQKGDYFLDGYADRCVIERKARLEEIAVNCLRKRRRKNFIAELDYLRAKCRYPVLLLIGRPQDYMRPSKNKHHYGVAYSALIRLLMERSIWLLTMPGETLRDRQAMGECAAHILISGAVTNEVLTRPPIIARTDDVSGEQDA